MKSRISFQRSRILIIVTIFLLLFISMPAYATLWSNKVDTQDLQRIITELRIYDDPNLSYYNEIFSLYYSGYTGSEELLNALNKKIEITQQVMKTLDADIKKEELGNLTYGRYILNAINEKELVEIGIKTGSPGQAKGEYFNKLGENLANWESQLSKLLLTKIIVATCTAMGAPALSIGISTLGLFCDLSIIGISINKLNEVWYEKAFWSYMQFRNEPNYDHIGAWKQYAEPYVNYIIILSLEKQKKARKAIEENFESLWDKYGDHIVNNELDKNFKSQQRESLKILLLYALGTEPQPIITSPLKMTPVPPYYLGDTINAEFTITNQGKLPIDFSVLTVGGRDPDNQVADLSHRQNITLEPFESYNYQGTLTLNKVGDYHFFCTYQTPDGEWNTNVDLGSKLTDEDRTEDIIVKEKPSIVPDISKELYIEWEKTFGRNKLDIADSIIQIKDGGYAVTGWTISEGHVEDIWLIKLDEQGNVLWEKTFGRYESGRAGSIIQTKDGGYAAAGNAYSKDTGRVDTWLIKLDEQGNTLWEKTFGRYESKVEGQSIIQTKDGGYAVTGWTRSKGYQDPWIIKLDEQGNVLWEKTFGENEFSGADSIIQTKDGGYAVAGWTPSKKGCGNAWITKLDEQGNVLWKKAFGENELDRADSIIQTKDGGYVVTKRSTSCTWAIGTEEGGTIKFDARIIKLDEQGNVLWEKTFGENELDRADSIIQTKDGGYAVTGWTISEGHVEDIWLIKLDEQGNVLWEKTFGRYESGRSGSIIQTKDGGYVVTGRTPSKSHEGAWIIKLDEQGNVLWEKTFGENEFSWADSIIQTKDGGYAVAGGTRLKGAEEWDWDVRIIKLKIGSTSTSAEQVTKEKLLIDSSLYIFEHSAPEPPGYLPVSVRGPADELALILANPEGETDIRFISKRALIDNFETVKLRMGNAPLSEGPYILTVKTVTPEKIIYKKELWFTLPDVSIADAEFTYKITHLGGAYGYAGYYFLEMTSLTLINNGDLPAKRDTNERALITLDGKPENMTLLARRPPSISPYKVDFYPPTYIPNGKNKVPIRAEAMYGLKKGNYFVTITIPLIGDETVSFKKALTIE